VLSGANNSYDDTTAKPGQQYIYQMGIEGRVQQAEWHEFGGPFTAYHEVTSALDPPIGAVASIAEPHYVRVLIKAEDSNPDALQTAFLMGQKAIEIPWVVVIEDQQAHALLDEQQVTTLTTAE